MVEHGVDISDDTMFLGSFHSSEEFFLGSIFRANTAFLVKLAEVIQIVDVVANTLDTEVYVG